MGQISNPVFYNDINLETITGLTVLRTNPYRIPRRNVSMSQLIHSDKSAINSANYTEKIISVGVGITRPTRALAERALDDLMALLQQINKVLKIPQSGGFRNYYATYADHEFVVAGGSYLELDLMFECSDRMGYDVASTLLLQITGFTSNYRSDLITLIGSALWQGPKITLTYTVLTGGTNQTVTIGNSGNGQELTITRTWAAGDVLVIDPLGNDGSGSVKVNGVEADFSGAVPMWKKGPGYWYYRDTFTTRTFSGQIRQIGRYT